MAIRAGVGLSKETDAYRAGYEAGKVAMEKAGGPASMVIAFASVRFNQSDLLRGIREATGNAPLVGCTDAGQITSSGPSKEAVAVMVISSDTIIFTRGLGEHIKDGAREAGKAFAQGIKNDAKEGLRAIVMFPDVLVGNGADIVRGAIDVLGEHFPVIGGAAGDDFLFQKTYQYFDQEAHNGSISGFGLSGKFTIGVGVRHGWMPLGTPKKVTRSEGAVVYEIDGQPAANIYKEYFGAERALVLETEPLARLAITYPLGIKADWQDEYLIRDPITINPADGSITCAAEIPQGSEIRLMIGSKEKAVEAAEVAASSLMKEFQTDGTTPKLLLIFNCIAREKLFGDKADDEIQAVRRIIGQDVPILGFYTYGEQAPINGEVRNTEKISSKFYNETIVMLALGD